MTFGRVTFCLSYDVDIDNKAMVDHAKEAILDDIVGMDSEDLEHCMSTQADSTATKDSIEEFLLDDMEDATP